MSVVPKVIDGSGAFTFDAFEQYKRVSQSVKGTTCFTDRDFHYCSPASQFIGPDGLHLKFRAL